MLLTRYGLREWLTATVAAGLLAAVFAWLGWWWALGVTVLAWLAVALFFRDPPRRVPPDAGPGALVSPADGRVTAVSEIEEHAVVGGPAVVIRVFLSILDVHVNRCPCDGEAVEVRYERGAFHDARSAASAIENENQLVTIRLDDGRRIGMRQIAGKVARRIVCALERGDRLVRGRRFGMIKFGSGAELILPRASVAHVAVKIGDRVRGGVTVVAELTRAGGSPEGPAPADAARRGGQASPRC